MECYSEQVVSIAVDGELAGEEARRLREHLATCQRCRDLVDALRAESRVLTESLHELPEEADLPMGVPRMPRSLGWSTLAGVAGVLSLGSIVVPWIDQLNIPSALEWLNPVSLSGGTNLFFNLSYYVAHGGTTMLADYAAVVGGLSLLFGVVLLLGHRGWPRQPNLCLLLVLLALSLPSFALERRHGEFIRVATSETVDDTLLATGNTVRIEGVVNGDLLAFGRTVEVRGRVMGDMITWADRTVVSGTVEGRIYNLSHSLDLDGPLSHSLYGAMQSLRVNDRGQVGDNIVVAAGEVSLEGEVKRSVNLITGNAEVSGSIGRDLTTVGGGLTLANTARVGGDLSARVRQLNDVHIADGATIAGKRDIQVKARESRFTRPRFYFYQVIWLAAAMLVGSLGLALVPGFVQATTQAVGSGWRSLVVGVGVLAGLPVVMVVGVITLVGIPVSLMLLALYLAAIYLAKIWVGAFLGRVLLKPREATQRDWLLGLLLGLLILTMVGFVPYFGGLVRFGVVCLGSGALAGELYRASRTTATT